MDTDELSNHSAQGCAGAPVPLAIEYEPPRGYVSRSRYRSLLFLSVLNFLALAAVVAGPPAWRWSKQKWEARRAAARAVALMPTLATPPPAAPAIVPATRSAEEQAALDVEDTWMTYASPPDRVVYEERQDEAKALLQKDRSYLTSVMAGYQNLNWIAELARAEVLGWQAPVVYDSKVPIEFEDGSPPSAHTVFIHGLTSSSGHSRLVHLRIETDGQYQDYNLGGGLVWKEVVAYRRQLRCDVMELPPHPFFVAHKSHEVFLGGGAYHTQYFRDSPYFVIDEMKPDEGLASGHLIATFVRNTKSDELYSGLDYTSADALRLFAGQADPVDPSHFTVDFVIGTTRGNLDGWLQDDNTIRLRATPAEGWRLREYKHSNDPDP